jgi:hypothetical protein
MFLGTAHTSEVIKATVYAAQRVVPLLQEAAAQAAR